MWADRETNQGAVVRILQLLFYMADRRDSAVLALDIRLPWAVCE